MRNIAMTQRPRMKRLIFRIDIYRAGFANCEGQWAMRGVRRYAIHYFIHAMASPMKCRRSSSISFISSIAILVIAR